MVEYLHYALIFKLYFTELPKKIATFLFSIKSQNKILWFIYCNIFLFAKTGTSFT